MPLYFKDIEKDPTLLENLGKKVRHQKCYVCKVKLQETVTGKRKIKGRYACSDCYYDKLGELIESHPIVSAGIHRG